MGIEHQLDEFYGLPVVDYNLEMGIRTGDPAAYRLSVDYDAAEAGQSFSELLGGFIADPNAGAVSALIIGCWAGAWESADSVETIESLASARDRLRGLRALFFGDITQEQCEISWINHGDMSALFEAYPQLEVFDIRGSNGLSLGRPKHERLEQLVIQTGGLPASVLREICSAVLPALVHLELWLGEENYGNDITNRDLEPLLSGQLFPALRYLGLRDDSHADVTAQLLSQAPLFGRIEVLDLSLGNLTDDGAELLLQNPHVAKLKKLDLHFHYLSDGMMKRLQSLGPEVDISDQQQPDRYGDEVYRYIAVSE